MIRSVVVLLLCLSLLLLGSGCAVEVAPYWDDGLYPYRHYHHYRYRYYHPYPHWWYYPFQYWG